MTSQTVNFKRFVQSFLNFHCISTLRMSTFYQTFFRHDTGTLCTHVWAGVNIRLNATGVYCVVRWPLRVAGGP